MAKPTLIDPIPYEQAGLTPPKVKKSKDKDCDWRKASVKKQLRILDQQTACSRYKWKNIPCNISSEELERLLYYKGQLCVFYFPALQSWYFMPFALDGTIDFYGRYNRVHPVPMAAGADGMDTDGAEQVAKQQSLLSTMKLEVLYGIPTEDKVEEWRDKFINGKACVILQDYTRQLGFMNISRQVLNDPLLDIMSDCIPFMRTSLLANTGIKGMRIPNEADYPNVLDANKAFEIAAVTGDMYVPIVGPIDFQDLTSNTAAKSEEFMLALQSLDNYRLQLYGLEQGGVFEKKGQMLQSEHDINAQKGSAALVDGLSTRKTCCDILNAVCELGISCDVGDIASKPIDANEDIIDEEEEDTDVSTDE